MTIIVYFVAAEIFLFPGLSASISGDLFVEVRYTGATSTINRWHSALRQWRFSPARIADSNIVGIFTNPPVSMMVKFYTIPFTVFECGHG